MTEDELIGWHHRLDGHESEQTPGDGEGQGSWHAAVQTVRHEWAHLTTPVFWPPHEKS